jgi:NAD(P)-dependent dehydrogenase (short-subunit alcohol dehydrogenase family)
MTTAARFANQSVIVTGAASGIGRACVVRLAAEGAQVLGVDLNAAGLDETVQLATQTAAHGGQARGATGSVADEARVRQIVTDFVGQAGKLDVLVNMAGFLRSSHTTETSLQSFLDILQVNLVGTFLCCREALPHLLKTRGNIVNAASTSAYYGHPYMAAYSASKGGVAALTHALAWEYLKQGVRVNAVAPGGIMTPLVEATPAGLPEDIDFKLIQHLTPITRFGTPENVAGVVAMLASEDGAHMTGEIVRIDGGVHS